MNTRSKMTKCRLLSKKLIKTVICLVAGVLLTYQASPANAAALVERDLFSAGDALLTYDPSTQLEWLDVTETMYISVNNILSGTGGWVDLGFRYATTDEVGYLMNSVGLMDLSGAVDSSYYSAASLFISLLGNTSGNTTNDATAGRAGIGDYGPGTVNMPVVVATGSGSGMADIDHYTGMTVDMDAPWNSSGSFLVRAVVPEPISSTLFLIGGATLGFRRLRKRES